MARISKLSIIFLTFAVALVGSRGYGQVHRDQDGVLRGVDGTTEYKFSCSSASVLYPNEEDATSIGAPACGPDYRATLWACVPTTMVSPPDKGIDSRWQGQPRCGKGFTAIRSPLPSSKSLGGDKEGSIRITEKSENKIKPITLAAVPSGCNVPATNYHSPIPMDDPAEARSMLHYMKRVRPCPPGEGMLNVGPPATIPPNKVPPPGLGRRLIGKQDLNSISLNIQAPRALRRPEFSPEL